MSLPSGYTQLEYIQSSGTQYINTRVKSPSSGLKIALGFEYIADHSEETLFGCQKNGAYSICPYGNPEFYVGSTIKLLSYSAELNTRYNLVVEAKNNKLTTTWNETSYTGSYSGSLESTQDIYLFANHIDNSVGQIVSIKLYECSMYVNDVMTRNFIPCKNPSGVIGLYDSVNSVFYANAGTGSFTAGPEVKGSHKTLIDGTWYDLKAGKCLVGGTAYSVKNGRVLVNSTGYNIPFSKGIPLNTITPGAILYLNESGSPVPFYIAKHDYESGLNGAGRTLVVRRNNARSRVVFGNNNAYATSEIDQWLTGTYISLLDTNVQNKIWKTKFYYTPGNYDKTVKTLERAVFILSGTELGETGTIDNVEGSAIPIAGTITSAHTLAGNTIWTRTPRYESYSNKYVVQPSTYGFVAYSCDEAQGGILPAFTLPGNIGLSQNTDGTYTLA